MYITVYMKCEKPSFLSPVLASCVMAQRIPCGDRFSGRLSSDHHLCHTGKAYCHTGDLI